MDRRIERLLSPSLHAAPREDQLLELSRSLRAEGKNAAARSLWESVFRVVESTSPMMAEYAYSVADDTTVERSIRRSDLFALFARREWSSADVPVELMRARASIIGELAIHSGDLHELIDACRNNLQLSGVEVGSMAVIASINCIHISNLILTVSLTRESPATTWPFADELARARASVRARILSVLSDNNVNEADAIVGTGRFQRVLALAMVGDIEAAALELSQPPLQVLVDESAYDAIHKLQIAHRSAQLLQTAGLPIWFDPPSLIKLLKQVAEFAKPESAATFLDDVWKSKKLGRVGLALSGGGLRAAFFHLGTLAHLAERDLLRHVEVLSTVSGGSLVGVLYYLEVRAVLASKRDSDVSKDDYIEIVDRLIDRISKGTSRNLRMRAFGHFGHVRAAILKGEFDRSVRIANLYDELFFADYFPQNHSKPTLGGAVALIDGAPTNDPETLNRRRAAKIPELVINATSLNDGERFSFSPYWMGNRFRNRVDDERALNAVQLSMATAASSCVPGVFNAVRLRSLLSEELLDDIVDWIKRSEEFGERYVEILATEHLSLETRQRQTSLFRDSLERDEKGYLAVIRNLHSQIVDGGVFDNQGFDALLEAGCDIMICSDAASPFLLSRRDASDIGAAVRANELLMKRVRDLVVANAELRKHPNRLSGVFLATLSNLGETQPSALHSSVNETLVRNIQAVRTDLDAFSETEASVLMASGYLVARQTIPDIAPGFIASQTSQSGANDAPWTASAARTNSTRGWPFSRVTALLSLPTAHSFATRKIGRQMAAAKHRFLRPFRLSIWHLLVVPAWIGALVAIQWRMFDLRGGMTSAVSLFIGWVQELLIAFIGSSIVWTVALIVASPFIFALLLGGFDQWIGRLLAAMVVPRNWLHRAGASLATVLTIPMRVAWLWIIDPLLLRSGNLSDTLRAQALTSVEKALKVVTLVGLIPVVFVLSFAVHDWYSRDADGRTSLSLPNWNPTECLRRLKLKETARHASGRTTVTILDPLLERMYCARKWDGAMLKSIAEVLETSYVPAIPAPFFNSFSRSEEKSANEFLKQQGAEEFVWFSTLRRYLPITYDAQLSLHKPVVSTDYPVSEGRSAAAKIAWESILSSDSASGTVIQLTSKTYGKIEVYKLSPKPLTVAAVARWSQLASVRRLRDMGIQYSAPLLASADDFLSALESDFLAAADGKSEQSGTPPDEKILQRRTARPIQILEVAALPPDACKDKQVETPSIVACVADERIFIVTARNEHGDQDLINDELLPSRHFATVGRIVARFGR